MRNWTLKYENAIEIHMKSREEILEAVRKVKRNGFSSTGVFASVKSGAMVQYESGLEQDFATTLEFNSGVARFVDQPLTIEYEDQAGKKRKYTPDFIAYYRKDRKEYANLPPHLFEVKTREDLKKNWTELKPKFMAAIRYSHKKGYKFKIITEQEIYTEYFINARFLIPYVRLTPEIGLINCILDSIELLETATPSEVLAVATNDLSRKAELIPALWYLIGQRVIGCDLNTRITMESEIWCKND